LKSNQDQPSQSKTKNKTQGTSTKNLILQTGSEVEIGNYDESDASTKFTIKCRSSKSARQLALELSGIKISSAEQRENEFRKLRTHPWYGTVLLEELNSDDRHFIALFVREHSKVSDQDFRIKVHRLFIDGPERPTNHALIQEVLSVVAWGIL